jgi:uncharacterized protein
MARLATLFAPKEREFFTLFEQAGENIVNGAELLERILAQWPEHQQLASDIRDCEQKGDQITHDLIQMLNERFITPIERDDIYDLASALDDIMDFIDEVASYLGIYQIEKPTAHAQELSNTLTRACHTLSTAIPYLRSLKDLSSYTIEVNRLENEGDRILREAVAELFARETDPLVVIRWKDIYERLEDAIDATETVVNILQGIVIRNL